MSVKMCQYINVTYTLPLKSFRHMFTAGANRKCLAFNQEDRRSELKSSSFSTNYYDNGCYRCYYKAARWNRCCSKGDELKLRKARGELLDFV